MDDALAIFQTGFSGASTELVTVGGLGVALAAIRWGVPYLKGFFKTTAK